MTLETAARGLEDALRTIAWISPTAEFSPPSLGFAIQCYKQLEALFWVEPEYMPPEDLSYDNPEPGSRQFCVLCMDQLCQLFLKDYK